MPTEAPVQDDASAENVAIAPFFTQTVHFWTPSIARWGREYGLDPNLIATIMEVESCGSPSAVSPAGAIGLFQVMPSHFLAGDEKRDPDTNARRGLLYFKGALARANDDVSLAAAGYNGGYGVIDVDPSRWPTETVRYRYFVEGIYADASAGLTSSDRMTEWYDTYGVSFCRDAADVLAHYATPTPTPTPTP